MFMLPDPAQDKNSFEAGGDKLVPLLEERTRIKEILRVLETKRSEVSEEVFQRVKMDYELRLGALNNEISRQARNFENTLKDYRDLVGRLEGAMKLGATSLEELKVRFTLGEYAENDYEAIGKEKKARIELFRSKIANYRVNMERLESVLSQLENS